MLPDCVCHGGLSKRDHTKLQPNLFFRPLQGTLPPSVPSTVTTHNAGNPLFLPSRWEYAVETPPNVHEALSGSVLPPPLKREEQTYQGTKSSECDDRSSAFIRPRSLVASARPTPASASHTSQGAPKETLEEGKEAQRRERTS